MSPKEAVSVIRPSDKVMSAPINVTPFTLCRALFDRRQELKGLHSGPLRSLLLLESAG